MTLVNQVKPSNKWLEFYEGTQKAKNEYFDDKYLSNGRKDCPIDLLMAYHHVRKRLQV